MRGTFLHIILFLSALLFRSQQVSAQQQIADSVEGAGLDSIANTNKRPASLKTSGTVSAGYDYGVIPFTVDSTFPTGYFKTEGNVQLEFLSLPVNFSFYYADIRTISGLNNYARISFDAERYKQNLRNRTAQKMQELKSKQAELYKLHQQAEQKLYFLRSMDKHASIPVDTSAIREMAIEKAMKHISGLRDSAGIPAANHEEIMDSAGAVLAAINTAPLALNKDSLQAVLVDQYEDSLTTALYPYAKYTNKLDSLRGEAEISKSRIEALRGELDRVSDAIRNYESAMQMDRPGFTGGKGRELMSYVSKLDVGLCYPSYSTFLVTGVPVKGVNIEVEKEKLFFAFTHGTTIGNQYISNNIIQNQLQGVRNLYNFFDFNDVEAGRKITAMKLGYGKREGNHLHFGLLYGKGKNTYLPALDSVLLPSTALEKNYVLELDGRFMINPSNSIDLIYGRSSVQQASISYEASENGFNALLSSHVRSNAALARFNSAIRKTGTRITLTGRWIDPFFKSYGVGFMRADNLRYEAKVDQPVSKKVKLSVKYRHDEDNLLALYSVNTTLHTLGAGITVRFNRHLTVRAAYNPVLQKVRSNDNTISFDNRNNISNAILTWMPKVKNGQVSLNAVYSYYQLYDGITNNIFQNAGLINTIQFKNPVKNNFSVNWFNAMNTDSLNGSTLIIADEVSYSGKKGLVLSVGGKVAQSEQAGMQAGGSARVRVPVLRSLSIEGGIERLVIGDFYSSYDIDQIEGFPYYSYIKLNCNW